jgi:hypothetical protein
LPLTQLAREDPSTMTSDRPGTWNLYVRFFGSLQDGQQYGHHSAISEVCGFQM